MKYREKTPAKTEGAYLHRLSKALLRYFPAGQVREILEDYQEHFSLGRERGGTDEALIAALGTPETVVADILRENPEGWLYLRRYAIPWGLLFLFSSALLVLRYTFPWRIFYRNTLGGIGSCFLLAMSALFLFALLRGREQASVEGRFPQKQPQMSAAVYLLPPGLPVLAEVLIQYVLKAVDGGLWLPLAPGKVGPFISSILLCSQAVLALLLLWLLLRTLAVSIHSFPAAVHTAGAMLAIQEIYAFLHSMDVSASSIPALRNMLLYECLLPYVCGIIIALLFRLYIQKEIQRGKER